MQVQKTLVCGFFGNALMMLFFPGRITAAKRRAGVKYFYNWTTIFCGRAGFPIEIIR